MKIIGIREEDKYVGEQRAAITPEHAKILINNQFKIEFVPSVKRSFTDAEYLNAGAVPSEELADADLIVGVKEMPNSFFREGKSYIFFSHTIKGQPYNMEMLRRMMDLRCNLIDYEKITDDNNHRLIFFGRFAGLAGAIDSLWSLGLRYKVKGFETPFSLIQQAKRYSNLNEAEKVIRKAANLITEGEIPQEIGPVIIGITGYGNVSKGVQEIIDLLPVQELTPDELTAVPKEKLEDKKVYKVIFKEEDMYRRRDGRSFDLQHFYHHPEQYESNFEQYTAHLSLLFNCMYWDNRADRIVTKVYLKKHWRDTDFRLEVIGDITCDPHGSIEATHQGTEIDNPVFVYHPESEEPVFGHEGEGILIMAVDILASELPRDASVAFSTALLPFIPAIATCDFSLPFSDLPLPAPIRRALILHQGELTPDFQYLLQYL